MNIYMPEIFYHDRKALLSVDVSPSLTSGSYRIATASVQNEVRTIFFNKYNSGSHLGI